MKENHIDSLIDITERIDQLEQSAEWIARATIHIDPAVSHTGSLICVFADQIREEVFNLVRMLEEAAYKNQNKDSETVH